jgi:GrpB-like predicted nucleotidyltransferase (UPF0157 family)
MNPVVIQDYDPCWPRLFEALRSRIAAVLESIAEAIEHVGSTAIPGLAAKPIIDMDVLLASDSDLALAIAKLASVGYEHRGDLGVPGREAFRAPPQDHPHHLYVCPPGSPAYLQHITFRDYLRNHRRDADAYAELKCDLAGKFRDDREAYNQAKSGFVAEILRRAAANSSNF